MLKQIFLFLLLVVSYLGLIGQPLTAINSNVSGSKPTFVAQGDISATSDLGSEQYSITLVNRSELLGNSTFIATNSAIGDIIIDGNGGIYEIISGTSPTFTVQLLNDLLDLPEPFFGFPAAPTPPVNIARPIGQAGLLPSYAFLGSGLDSRIITVIDNYNKNQLEKRLTVPKDALIFGGPDRTIDSDSTKFNYIADSVLLIIGGASNTLTNYPTATIYSRPNGSKMLFGDNSRADISQNVYIGEWGNGGDTDKMHVHGKSSIELTVGHTDPFSYPNTQLIGNRAMTIVGFNPNVNFPGIGARLGDFIIRNYPNTLNQSATYSPLNFLYTDANAVMRSSIFGAGMVTDPTTTNLTPLNTTLNNILVESANTPAKNIFELTTDPLPRELIIENVYGNTIIKNVLTGDYIIADIYLSRIDTVDWQTRDLDYYITNDYDFLVKGYTVEEKYFFTDTYILGEKINSVRESNNTVFQTDSTSLYLVGDLGNIYIRDLRSARKGLQYETDYSTDLMNNPRSVPDVGTVEQMITNSRPYKVYTALLTQEGTSAPVATVLENTLGETIIFTRFGAGMYRTNNPNNIFNSTKTFVLFTGGNGDDLNGIYVTGGYSNQDSVITFSSYDNNVRGDDLLSDGDGFFKTSIEIRVYP